MIANLILAVSVIGSVKCVKKYISLENEIKRFQ